MLSGARSRSIRGRCASVVTGLALVAATLVVGIAGTATPASAAPTATFASSIATGGTHACGVTRSGGAKCWGSGSSGQLGRGSTVASSLPVDVTGLTSGVASVTAGGTHS